MGAHSCIGRSETVASVGVKSVAWGQTTILGGESAGDGRQRGCRRGTCLHVGAHCSGIAVAGGRVPAIEARTRRATPCSGLPPFGDCPRTIARFRSQFALGRASTRLLEAAPLPS